MNGFTVLLIELGALCLLCGAAQKCNWSNEGCSSNSDCCSGECFLAHEGTDYRCTRSSLSKRCVFDYHCKDGLNCGPFFNCCSPYWENCVQDKDCCDTEHRCESTAGFIYKKCLYPSSGNHVLANSKIIAFLALLTLIAKAQKNARKKKV